MISNPFKPLSKRVGARGVAGVAAASGVAVLTAGIALAYTGSLPTASLGGGNGPAAGGSLGSSGATTVPSTPPSTTSGPSPTTSAIPSVDPPPPATNGISVVARQAQVAASEQHCHITVYYGPLTVGEGRGYVMTVGPERSVLGPTEVGEMGDGTYAYRLTEPVMYVEQAIDRSYFAMEIALGEDGSQILLEDPEYHYLGTVQPPEDGTCSTDGRDVPVVD